MLVRIAGESLASSAQKFASERREQCALGLQKLAPNRQLAHQPEIKILGVLVTRIGPGKSRQIIANLPGIGIF